ncbi:MAG: hypothetical protein QXG17_04205 [Sulfolobales archaeon]
MIEVGDLVSMEEITYFFILSSDRLSSSTCGMRSWVRSSVLSYGVYLPEVALVPLVSM